MTAEAQTEQAAAANRLQAYFDQIAVDQQALTASKPTDSALRRVVKNGVPVHRRGQARIMLTRAVAARERRKAAALVGTRQPLLLHLGSGGERKQGWVNIDLAGDPVDIAWELSRGLPFPDASVDGIFHEHLIEHLRLRDGLSLTTECYRLLRPGGRLRIGVPDVAELIRQYVEHEPALLDTRVARPTGLLVVQEMFYWHRHCTMYDEETLSLVLAAAGFAGTSRRAPGETGLPLVPDTGHRRERTLYLEAVKE